VSTIVFRMSLQEQ